MYIETLIISIIINVLFFIPAYLLKSDKFTDFSYGLSFFVLGLYLFAKSDMSIFDVLLFSMITIWSARIAAYLLIRILKTKKDLRFDGVREKFWKFFGFWILQAITVWIILLPTIYFLNFPKFYNSQSEILNSNLQIEFIIIGSIIWLIGIIIESVADQQKFKFKNDINNSGKWIDTGLWKYSRHPNYLGEILIWLGVYIFTLSIVFTNQNLSGEISNYKNALIGLISPIYIFVLLRFVSGIPPLEKKSDEKYGQNPEYLNYKNHTNLLFIGPRKDID